jgi:hypothetical protein
MFTHAVDFFKKHTSLKKLIPAHFFTSLFNNLLIKDLVTLGNLLSTKFLKPRRWLYATPGSTSRNQPKCNHSIYDYMWLVVVCNWIWEYLQLQNQISTILVIFTTMMQLLKFSSYWLDRFYIHFHPLIGWYVPLIAVITKLVAS